MKKTISKLWRGAGVLLASFVLLGAISCSDGSGEDTEKTDNPIEEVDTEVDTESTDYNALNMVNTTWTKSQTLDTTTEFTNFGEKAYLVYSAVPLTSSSSIELSAHIKFNTETAITKNSCGHNGVGFVEMNGSDIASYVMGGPGSNGVKAVALDGSSLTYTGGMGYTVTENVAVGTEYVAHIKISNKKWTISYYDSKDKNLLWTKNNTYENYYKDTATVYLAIGGTKTDEVTYSDVKVKVDSTTNAITTLSYGAMASISVGETSATVSTLDGTNKKEITVTATNSSGKACAWTAESSDSSIATVSPASGTASDSKLTITGVGVGKATITVTNAKATSLTKTISVTVANFPSSNTADVTAAGAYPAKGSVSAYRDAQLRLQFDAEPVLENGGYITINKADGTIVDSIKFADEVQTAWSGSNINVGSQLVRVDGTSVYITPHFNTLEAGTKYYVAIPDGSINGKIGGKDFSGIANSLDETNGWYFTTKADPALSTTTITVNNEESDTEADFHSLNAALYAIKDKTDTYTINIASGTYYELVYYKGKASVTIVGQGTESFGADTVIEYINCNDMNGGTHIRPVMYFGGSQINVVLKNLTVKNLTERGTSYITGKTASSESQAEAIHFANGAEKDGKVGTLAAYNCKFVSKQDTILTSGRNWFYKCYIEGDVDFIWGTADAALFEDCTLVSVNDTKRTTKENILLETRVGSSADGVKTVGKGYVVLGGTLTIQSGITQYLGRCAGASGVYNQGAVVNTQIQGEGTLKTNLFNTSSYLYLEGDSENVGWKVYGLNVDTSGKAANTSVISNTTYNAEYKNRDQILNRVYNIEDKAYQDASLTWDISSLETAFGVD